jgi:excisionase family DNA binding protein
MLDQGATHRGSRNGPRPSFRRVKATNTGCPSITAGTLRDVGDRAIEEWIERLPLARIAAVIVLLSARLVAEKKSDDVDRRRDTHEHEALLTAGELAKRLNVPESWVRSEQRAGRIPFKRLGKYVRFSSWEVEAVLSETTA